MEATDLEDEAASQAGERGDEVYYFPKYRWSIAK